LQPKGNFENGLRVRRVLKAKVIVGTEHIDDHLATLRGFIFFLAQAGDFLGRRKRQLKFEFDASLLLSCRSPRQILSPNFHDIPLFASSSTQRRRCTKYTSTTKVEAVPFHPTFLSCSSDRLCKGFRQTTNFMRALWHNASLLTRH
jgi:hypothetical protein